MLTPENKTSVFFRMYEVKPGDLDHMATLSKLHMDLLGSGPVASLGEYFVREICYRIHLHDGLMKAVICEINGSPAGFIAFTSKPSRFNELGLKKHLPYMMWVFTIAMVRSPLRLRHMKKAVQAAIMRHGDQAREGDKFGESLCIAVYPEYLTSGFTNRTGLKIGEELVKYAAKYFHNAGLKRMRMIVNADNKPALFFYHRLGARFEPVYRNTQKEIHVWLDL